MDRYNQAHKIATPAVSLSTDGGQHGSHCYDADGLLICGWPNEHPAMLVNPFRPNMLTGSNRAELDNVARMVAEADDLRS